MTVLITAGPTYEPIDPVRFIGNHSSGKMGYALAEEAKLRGHKVILISGPTHLNAPKGVTLVKVQSAAQMFAAVEQHFDQAELLIFAAAVADYTPKVVSDTKIKKKSDEFTIELVKTVDIAKTIGQQKKPNQLMVGFALETDNELENAQKKLASKNMDFIVLNSTRNKGTAFGFDDNQITIVSKSGTTEFGKKPKTEVAKDILDFAAQLR